MSPELNCTSISRNSFLYLTLSIFSDHDSGLVWLYIKRDFSDKDNLNPSKVGWENIQVGMKGSASLALASGYLSGS